MAEIDWTKPIQTADGDTNVRVLGTLNNGNTVIAWMDEHGHETVHQCDPSGKVRMRHPECTIVNIPPPPRTAERWLVWLCNKDGVWVYKETLHTTSADAYYARLAAHRTYSHVPGFKAWVQHVQTTEPA